MLTLLLCISSSIAHGMLLDANPDTESMEKNIHAKIKKRSKASTSSELVEFKYDKKNLKDLLNEFAHKLNINILYPETETITTTVTFDAGKRLTIAEAWDFVIMILEQATYSLVLRGDVYTLVSNSKTANEPLPLYIGVDYHLLPDNCERLRFIYYFNNIQISKQKATIKTILDDIVSPETAKQIMFEEVSNMMIITARSEIIKMVMQLITVLDEVGFQEAVDVLPLEYVKVADIVPVLKSLIGALGKDPRSIMISGGSAGKSHYFSEHVRIESLDAKDAKRPFNSVIIMGKLKDVEEVKRFIKKYLDIPLESGDPFFHVVDLQWLNAQKFAPILQDFVKGSGSGDGQSTASTASDLDFEKGIKIIAEKPAQGSTTGENVAKAAAANASGASQGSGGSAAAPVTNNVQRGGNKLIIACSSKDWSRIESMIKQLDIPQKQVVIEGLVMDLDLAFSRSLGVQLRTRGLDSSIFPKNMQAQAGLLINNILGSNSTTSSDSYTLLGDLSDLLSPGGLNDSGGNTNLSTPQTSTLTSGSGGAAAGVNGSTIFMINGGKTRTNGVWAFFQLLSQHTASRVYTRPFLMVQNNQQATVGSTVSKSLPGAVTPGVAPTITYTPVTAPVSIAFTPLISENNMINLQLAVNLTSWLINDTSAGTQNTRTLNTNVSMKSGDLLILGGLIQDTTSMAKYSVPFFERIPIIGNLFANRNKTITKDQLYILLRVTVVEPRVQGGIGPITQTASNFMVEQFAEYEEAFAGLKDPITRWFFNSDRKQSASECLQERISELPAFDLGKSGIDIELDNKQVIHKPAKTLENMKIGWFSNEQSDNAFNSKSTSSSNDSSNSSSSKGSSDDKLSAFLKDMENPFEKRLLV